MTRRALIDPFVVGPPRAVSARTRLFVSLTDEQVLTQVGDHLGSLLRSDLATRCRLGAGPKHLGRAKRKRALTSRCSSRWAGAITRVTDDMWERELLNRVRMCAERSMTIAQSSAPPIALRHRSASGTPWDATNSFTHCPSSPWLLPAKSRKVAHGRARLKLSREDLVELQCGGMRGKARETRESRNSERRPSGPSTNSKQRWTLRTDLCRSRRKSPRKNYHRQDRFLFFS